MDGLDSSHERKRPAAAASDGPTVSSVPTDSGSMSPPHEHEQSASTAGSGASTPSALPDDGKSPQHEHVQSAATTSGGASASSELSDDDSVSSGSDDEDYPEVRTEVMELPPLAEILAGMSRKQVEDCYARAGVVAAMMKPSS